MSLTTSQRGLLHEALLDMFRSRGALAKFLLLELDWRLSNIAGNGTLDEAVLAVIDWAESREQVALLIEAVARETPDNETVKRALSSISPLDDTLRTRLTLDNLLEELPGSDTELFGRDEELRWLDHCHAGCQKRVVVLFAFGGVGKTALVRGWLGRLRNSPPDGTRFLGISFFSQGTRERVGSSDQFLYEALKVLGDPEPTKGSSWIRAKRLALLLAKAPSVLVLDGLEPLQAGPGDDAGKLRDIGIRELLHTLVTETKNVFCVITTRFHLTEPYLTDPYCEQRSLDLLSWEAAVRLLRSRGVQGNDSDFVSAVRYLGCHALALHLAAEYLNTYENGDIGRIRSIPLVNEETKAGRHAKSVLAAYQRQFERVGDDLELELLQILALFDRPVPPAWMETLRGGPAMAGFNRFHTATAEQLAASIDRLAKWGLMGTLGASDILDCHPLVREYFGAHFRQENLQGWEQANLKLFGYFRAVAPLLPQTVEQIEPLLMAVMHGCRAGMYGEAIEAVYKVRIMHGEFFASAKLGMIGPLLSALSNFFPGGNWGAPLPPALQPAQQTYLLNQVGYFITALRGYAAPEVASLYERAREANRNAKDSAAEFQIAYGLFRYHSAKGDLTTSLDEGTELLKAAAALGGSQYGVAARRALATTLYRLGRFGESLDHAMAGVEVDRREGGTSSLEYLGDDPGVNCRCLASMSLWQLGFASQAVAIHGEALRLVAARASGHGRAVALYLGLYLLESLRNYPAVLAAAEEMIDLSLEHGFHLWLAAGKIRMGWAIAMMKEMDKGIGSMSEGLRMWEATGAKIGLSYWYGLLAEAHLAGRDYTRAELAIERAIAIVSAGDERWYEPELYRLKGEILLGQAHDEDEAAESLARALDLARKRKTKAFELRAAVSLAVYWMQSARSGEARLLLRPILEGFSEGTDTNDYQQGIAVLAGILE